MKLTGNMKNILKINKSYLFSYFYNRLNIKSLGRLLCSFLCFSLLIGKWESIVSAFFTYRQS